VSSLAKLIEQIRNRPRLITGEWWISGWRDPTDPDLAWEAEQAWVSPYANKTREHLDPRIPKEDYATLLRESKHVTDYVDAYIAHSGQMLRRASPSSPAEVENVPPDRVSLSAKDVHEAIDAIGELFKKYYNLLTASSFAFLEPVIQHDWMAVFRVPWMKPESD
jgi:hypothetical protein